MKFAMIAFASSAEGLQSLSWVEGTGGAGPPTSWAPRYGHAAVCFEDGTVVTTGGNGNLLPTSGDEVHTTTAGGTELTEVTQSTFPARYYHAAARVPGNDNSFLVAGGYNASYGLTNTQYLNDCFLTADRGVNWVLQSTQVFSTPANGGANGRGHGHSHLGLVATDAATFIAFGGKKYDPENGEYVYYNQVRQSIDSGKTWSTLRTDGGAGGECSTSSEMWSQRASFGYAFMPILNRIIVTSGDTGAAWPLTFEEDVWGSDDGGKCWTKHSTLSYPALHPRVWGPSLVVVTVSGFEVLILAAGTKYASAAYPQNIVDRSLDGGLTWENVLNHGNFGEPIWLPRSQSALVFDATKKRLVLLGGRGGVPDSTATTKFNDVWTAYASTLTILPTGLPTRAPIVPTGFPTVAPVTQVPTAAPSTTAPTANPVTSAPSSAPITPLPTTAPLSQVPTGTPTANPITSAPTLLGETYTPTSGPSTAQTTQVPTSWSPTRFPTTRTPTRLPTTSTVITLFPTNEPDHAAQTSQSSTGASSAVIAILIVCLCCVPLVGCLCCVAIAGVIIIAIKLAKSGTTASASNVVQFQEMQTNSVQLSSMQGGAQSAQVMQPNPVVVMGAVVRTGVSTPV